MKKTSRKVVIVGTGFVGTSIAYAMINQGISNELVLIDVNQEKAEGEALDLLDGMAWGDENVAVWSGGYEECKDADIVVITAGINQKPGQSRLDLVKTNASIMRQIVKEIMGSGFDGIIVVASNPVDILTYIAWNESGLPTSRVIGTGTTLDTTRFRKEILNNEQAVLPVSAYLTGEYDEKDIFTGVPSIVDENGVREVVELSINEEEKAMFSKSTSALREVLNTVL
ncbi:L-lactate dehydrogenase [Enterococcus faecium]|nr:L-lactate dehydrogenase [Enterococcus faecium]